MSICFFVFQTRAYFLLGGNDCTSVESRSLDVKDGSLVTVLPKAEECFRGPALDASWT